MNTYRQTMDDLRFTDRQKQEMVERLTSAQPVRRPRLHRRVVAVALAAALVLAVSVGATGGVDRASRFLGQLLGMSPVQTEIIDRIGRPVGASDTSGGVTVTVDAIIGDAYSYVVVCSLEREDGQNLAQGLQAFEETGALPLSYGQMDLDVGTRSGSHGYSYFFDADPADSAIQFAQVMTLDEPIRPGTARLTIRDLVRYEDRAVVVRGSWDITFQLRFEDCSVELPAGQTFRTNGMAAVLDKVTISPLSIQVEYTVDGLVRGQETREDGGEDIFQAPSICLNMADGSVLELDNLGGGLTPQGDKTLCQWGGLYPHVVDLEQVDSVTIGTVTIPVPGV